MRCSSIGTRWSGTRSAGVRRTSPRSTPSSVATWATSRVVSWLDGTPTTAASRVPGIRATAASASPSSTRTPRTFTWRSMRPRYSSSRSWGPACRIAGGASTGMHPSAERLREETFGGEVVKRRDAGGQLRASRPRPTRAVRSARAGSVPVVWSGSRDRGHSRRASVRAVAAPGGSDATRIATTVTRSRPRTG